LPPFMAISVITLAVNWLIKPFTMAGLGVLFFE
jgi:ACR3 family arsenite efflux pump ArsB